MAELRAIRLPVLSAIVAALVIGCAAQPAGPQRPTSATGVACLPPAGGAFTAEFAPGSARNPVDMLMVTFSQKPTSANAEAALRACIEGMRATVRVDYETMANAWVGDEGPLDLPDGSRHMFFEPKAGTIKTAHERDGIKPTTTTRDGYTVEVTETKRAVPPHDSFYTVTVLFATRPLEQRALEVLTDEVSAVVSAHTPKADVLGFVSVGPVSDRNAQQQIRGKAGRYLSLDYDAKSGKLTDQAGNLVSTIR